MLNKICVLCGTEYEGKGRSKYCRACADIANKKSKQEYFKRNYQGERRQELLNKNKIWKHENHEHVITQQNKRRWAKGIKPIAEHYREIGSEDICQYCSNTYIVRGGRQRYCSCCASERIKKYMREYKRKRMLLLPLGSRKPSE